MACLVRIRKGNYDVANPAASGEFGGRSGSGPIPSKMAPYSQRGLVGTVPQYIEITHEGKFGSV